MWKQNNLFADQNPPVSEPVSPDVQPDEQPENQTNQAGKKKTKTLRRRKKANRKVDDYYALLEVGIDAEPDAIKRGYIAKVKQYSPENHPAEFQQIRAAYETLRDPELRKQYNILCRYGESIEDLLQEATNRPINKYSVNLLERAVAIDPKCIKAHLALAYAYLFLDRKLDFAGQFYKMKQLVDAEQWVKLWMKKITMLMYFRQIDTAFTELQKFATANPSTISDYWNVYLEVYSAAERETQLLDELEAKIRTVDTPDAQSIVMYTAWICVADALEESKNCLKAQAAARQFIKNHRNPEDVPVIVNILLEQYHEYREDTDFSTAKIFIDLALEADKKNKELQKISVELQLITAIMQELDRITMDTRVFPPVLIDAILWITEEFEVMNELLEEIEQAFPERFINEMRDAKEEYAASIIYLRKKYPAIYRQYRQRWDELFKEKTTGMNREARRSLRL